MVFMDFEMPLLQALVKLGGKATPKDVYPEVEQIMELTPDKFPEEYMKPMMGRGIVLLNGKTRRHGRGSTLKEKDSSMVVKEAYGR